MKNTVHRYMSLVQCPVCRYYYMEDGEECCWSCFVKAHPAATEEELAANRERLERAVHALHAARIEAERESGALGSMEGLGFAPAGAVPALPARHVDDTYAGLDDDARYTVLPPEPVVAETEGIRVRTLPPVLAVAGIVAAVALVVMALVFVLAVLAVGASAWLLWRLLFAPRSRRR